MFKKVSLFALFVFVVGVLTMFFFQLTETVALPATAESTAELTPTIGRVEDCANLPVGWAEFKYYFQTDLVVQQILTTVEQDLQQPNTEVMIRTWIGEEPNSESVDLWFVSDVDAEGEVQVTQGFDMFPEDDQFRPVELEVAIDLIQAELAKPLTPNDTVSAHISSEAGMFTEFHWYYSLGPEPRMEFNTMMYYFTVETENGYISEYFNSMYASNDEGQVNHTVEIIDGDNDPYTEIYEILPCQLYYQPES